jgi:VacB/RNase II family 3'-5' exoribonuclease
MMSVPREPQRALLLRVARNEMLLRGFEPDFPAPALAEAESVAVPRAPFEAEVRDLRDLTWCSIDNDDSRDLDQLTVALPLPGGGVKVMVAVADVSLLVTAGSAVDAHAAANTTSIYTPPQNFPMLPERLSTDLTSLGLGEDRLAVIVETAVDGEGGIGASSVYRAVVRNHAKLAYPSVGAWLEGSGDMPAAVTAVPGLPDGLRLQDQVTQRLKTYRHEHGALELETIEVRARFDGDAVSELKAEGRNRAKEIIEDFMIAANGAIARFLEGHGFPVMRRVVRSPERWQRIADIALEHGGRLPAEPDAKALHDFLVQRRAADPLRFPDLSLSVIKLLGRGEYVASFPGAEVDGHFGLAVSDYTHSTAPNRRYPDLITQRLLKAALAGQPAPYGREQLETLASHCTQKEDDAQKVERLLRKAAAACLLDGQIGREFDGIVTGASPKGTWARIFDPPVEGRIEQGSSGLDVGDRVRLKLIHTDPERGFIDFARAGHVGARHRGSIAQEVVQGTGADHRSDIRKGQSS